MAAPPYHHVDVIRLLTDSHPDVPGLDTGISHALMRGVAEGTQPETLRLHATGDLVAFGRHDTLSRGYARAAAAARRHGFVPIERLAGGRAAVFHTGTLAFAWAIPTEDPRAGVIDRFEAMATIVHTALTALGADARIGELDGEYCPGAYSIHVGDIKVMGVGQRLVRGAAHVGGVICVTDGGRIRSVLTSVYEELGLDWRPSTAGALEDVIGPLTVGAVSRAVRSAFDEEYGLDPGPMPPELVVAGSELAQTHLSTATA